jgi:hypothetical protein
MKKKTKQCCFMICGATVIVLAIVYVYLQYRDKEAFNNIHELNEQNNHRQIMDPNIMNNDNSNQVKPFSENILKNKIFRNVNNHQDDNIHFFSDVKFAANCSSNYSDSTGQACLTEEQSRQLVNRGNKHQSPV